MFYLLDFFPVFVISKGNEIINVVPSPSLLFTSIDPECLFTIMSWEILSPSPVPIPTGLVEKKGLNILLEMKMGIYQKQLIVHFL